MNTMTKRIDIFNVKNAENLDQFIPVEGQWSVDGDSGDRSWDDVAEAVRNWMDADYKIEVRLFHADGREITGELPAAGTFLATRS